MSGGDLLFAKICFQGTHYRYVNEVNLMVTYYLAFFKQKLFR